MCLLSCTVRTPKVPWEGRQSAAAASKKRNPEVAIIKPRRAFYNSRGQILTCPSRMIRTILLLYFGSPFQKGRSVFQVQVQLQVLLRPQNPKTWTRLGEGTLIYQKAFRIPGTQLVVVRRTRHKHVSVVSVNRATANGGHCSEYHELQERMLQILAGCGCAGALTKKRK